jgi:hypothetical protein
MNFHKIIFRIIIVLMLAPLLITAQDNRTVKTKVADVLALLPAANNQEANRLFHELINLGDEGLTMLTDGVKPNGKAEGVASRYAVSLLTHYATAKADKARIEQLYLAALGKANDVEVKAYFMDNLKLAGSGASVKILSAYFADKDLSDPAISALESIGTEEARQALLDGLKGAPAIAQRRLIKALGLVKYKPAVQPITAFVSSNDPELKKQALWSLALLADAGSYDVMIQHAKSAGFKNDPAEATTALIEYMHQVSSSGHKELAVKISQTILDNTADASQQHFRLAALGSMTTVNPDEAVKMLIKERNRFDAEYRKEVLTIAMPHAGNAAALKLWEKEYKKSAGAEQAEILSMLAGANRKEGFIEATLLPALSSKNQAVRIGAAEEIAASKNKKFAGPLVNYLLACTDDAELQAAKISLLQVTDKDNGGLLAQKIEDARPKNKVVLLEVLAERRAVNSFDAAAKLLASSDTVVKSAAYKALPSLSSGNNIGSLLSMLATAERARDVKAIQASIVSALDARTAPQVLAMYQKEKIKLLPVLPYVKDNDALEKVVSTFYNGSEQEKEIAFEALVNWQNNEAARTLLSIRKNDALKKYHSTAFTAFVTQVSRSSWPDDQKLLMLREIMTLASGAKEKNAVIRAVGSLRTFLALVFVSEYLDDKELSATASRSAMQIALPTSDAKPGLSGVEVRGVLQRILDKLTGGDSQYERIDIVTYLDKMPYTRGYEPIFNGKDLAGWQGLVENPIARAKMTKEVLAKKQQEADAKIKDSWSVKDGAIWFSGDGANLCTTRPYGDFEMIVDWKISKNGDSGIYLRGSPQVQIWDISRVDAGAQVGSGGLYNNKKNRSTPLAVTDNPIGEWNTFRIKMVGDRVTVYSNGILVVDDVVMENYWDRNLPIFPEEAIELQAHGTELAFRNIYVKELSHKPYELTKEEKEQGFEVLFNGKDLNNWVGNKTDYVVEDNTIAIYPAKGGRGNLNTEKEYSDFIFRFEFQLTPGANNGLGIHAPLEGDAAYLGKEIQILDNTAPVYAKLEQYQYHGSVYGVIAAKRDFLKPVGEWNTEEVYVKGDYIKITLNGTVILEGDMKKASKNGTLDHKEHPGLNRHKGHIGFLGHGSVVKFRSIRIKELGK